jgi:hypothetical protein
METGATAPVFVNNNFVKASCRKAVTFIDFQISCKKSGSVCFMEFPIERQSSYSGVYFT